VCVYTCTCTCRVWQGRDPTGDPRRLRGRFRVVDGDVDPESLVALTPRVNRGVTIAGSHLGVARGSRLALATPRSACNSSLLAGLIRLASSRLASRSDTRVISGLSRAANPSPEPFAQGAADYGVFVERSSRRRDRTGSGKEDGRREREREREKGGTSGV